MNFSDSTTALTQADTAVALLIDLVSITLFAIGIYFTRHRRKDLALVFWFFNVGLFVTVTVIRMTEVAAALGFGLFAILSIIRLRSEPFDNREIAYFFGALVLGLLNGIGTEDRWFTLALNGVLLVSMFVLDHPLLLRSGTRRRITFDGVITDEVVLRATLGERLGVTVLDCTVVSIDLIKDSMDLEIRIDDPFGGTSRTVVPAGAGTEF